MTTVALANYMVINVVIIAAWFTYKRIIASFLGPKSTRILLLAAVYPLSLALISLFHSLWISS